MINYIHKLQTNYIFFFIVDYYLIFFILIKLKLLKSNIKLIEAGALGIPAVCPDIVT